MKAALFDLRGPHGTLLVNLDQVLRIEGTAEGGTKLTLVRGEVFTHESFTEVYKRLREAGWTAR